MPEGKLEAGPVDSSLIVPLISGSGVAGIFCILFVMGIIFPRQVVTDLKDEITELKRQLEAERERANTAVAAVQATGNVVAAVQAGIHLGTKADGAA